MGTVPVIWSDLDPLLYEDSTGGLALDINEASVRASIDNILGTSPGERVFLPQFAVGVQGLLFEPMNPTILNSYTNNIKTAIETWDNRVTVQGVNVAMDADTNYLSVSVSFTIVGITQILTQTTQISG